MMVRSCLFKAAKLLLSVFIVTSCASIHKPDGTGLVITRSAPQDLTYLVSSSGNVQIAGVVTLPAGAGPYPAVLLLHGNGPHDRDQMISKSPMFKMISDYFVERGYAVARYDRRGYGASTGTDHEHHTTKDSADDARAVIEHIRSLSEINPKEIALLGHSEGAMTGAMIAADDEDISLLMVMGPPGLSGAETWANQLADNLRKRGASDEIAEAVRAQLLRYAAYVAAGPHPEDDDEFYRIGYDFIAAHGIPEEQNTREFAKQLISGYRVPWYRFFFAYDIAEDLKRVRQPVIAAFAEHDENVPPADHFQPFVDALKAGGNKKVAAKILPDEDHFFLRHDGERLEKHVPGEMEVSTALLGFFVEEAKRYSDAEAPR